MQQIGYSLIDSSGTEVWHVGEQGVVVSAVPDSIPLPNGDRVHCAVVGDAYGSWKLVGRWINDPAPAACTPNGQTVVWDGTEIVVTVTYGPPDLAAYAYTKRLAKEGGGITVVGIPILTDDRSLMMMIGARVSADADPTFITTWPGGDGHAYSLTAPQIIAISDAVSAHISACAVTYGQVLANIHGGTITTTAQVDAAFAAQQG